MPKVTESSRQLVLIQAICTQWEKSSRGGASAVQRNKVPESLKVSDIPLASAPLMFVVDRVNYRGRNGYAEPTRSAVEVLTTEPAKLGGLSLAFDEDILTVFYQYSRSQGAPERYSRKMEALKLSLNQWGRVLYNGRHSGIEGYWHYQKWVYNVGLFSSPPTPSVFVTIEPTKVFSQMAHLW